MVVADVRGLEHGQRLLVRNRTSPAVGVEHRDSKTALSEARPDRYRRAVAGCDRSISDAIATQTARHNAQWTTDLGPTRGACETLHPNTLPFSRCQVVRLSLNGRAFEVVWHLNPIGFVEKRRLIDEDAADPEVLLRIGVSVEARSNAYQPIAHLPVTSSTIRLSVHLPH